MLQGRDGLFDFGGEEPVRITGAFSQQNVIQVGKLSHIVEWGGETLQPLLSRLLSVL